MEFHGKLINSQILKHSYGDKFDADQITLETPGVFGCKKKPVLVHAIQLNYPEGFKVTTKEGLFYKGKPGDYLMFGVEGERYPCDKAIFEKTYKKLSEDDIASKMLMEEEKELKTCKFTEHNYQIIETYHKDSEYIKYASLYCTKCGNVIEIKSSDRG